MINFYYDEFSLEIRLVSTNPPYYVRMYIKTHDSESRGQEEAGLRDEPVSYLQVASL